MGQTRSLPTPSVPGAFSRISLSLGLLMANSRGNNDDRVLAGMGVSGLAGLCAVAGLVLVGGVHAVVSQGNTLRETV